VPRPRRRGARAAPRERAVRRRERRMTDERMPAAAAAAASAPSSPAPGAPIADEPLDPTILESEVVYRGRVGDVRNDVVEYGDGSIPRHYVDHPGASAIVALDDDDRVLLIQQYRHPIRHRDWEVPAGLLDVDGESPLQTAQRELAEEVDLVAAEWEPLVSIFTTPGGNDEVVHPFLAPGLSPAGQVHERADEEAEDRQSAVHGA